MEDILGIVVVILVYAFVLRGKNKGKKKKNSKGAVKNPAGRGADRAAAFRQAFSEIPPASAPVQEGERRPAQIRTKLEEEMHAREAEGKVSGRPERERRGVDGETPPEKRARPGMRFVDVLPNRMRDAGEGEDPCHVGAASREEDVFAPRETDRRKEEALARDVLRGVVMSEILMRPHERAALRRAKRRM